MPGAGPLAGSHRRAAIQEQGNNVPTVIVDPHWLGHGGAFWYEHRGRSGYRYVAVEPAADSRRPPPEESITISEPFVVTANGCECLSKVPRQLFVKASVG